MAKRKRFKNKRTLHETLVHEYKRRRIKSVNAERAAHLLKEGGYLSGAKPGSAIVQIREALLKKPFKRVSRGVYTIASA